MSTKLIELVRRLRKLVTERLTVRLVVTVDAACLLINAYTN